MMTKPVYEIGVVYTDKQGRYWVAVRQNLLLTFKKGDPVTIKPYTKYKSVRIITVEELCERWAISLDRLDLESAKYFTPPTLRNRPRGRRRVPKDRIEAEGRALRTVQLANA